MTDNNAHAFSVDVPYHIAACTFDLKACSLIWLTYAWPDVFPCKLVFLLESRNGIDMLNNIIKLTYCHAHDAINYLI